MTSCKDDDAQPDRPSIRDVRDLLRDLRTVSESSDPAEREAFLARKRAMLAAIDQDEQVG